MDVMLAGESGLGQSTFMDAMLADFNFANELVISAAMKHIVEKRHDIHIEDGMIKLTCVVDPLHNLFKRKK
jgi:septin family protein